jgi:hypothetical protein
MHRSLKDYWQRLKSEVPGRRFRRFYDFRKKNGSRHVMSSFLSISTGLGLVVGGLAIGWLPGPGGFIAIIGLALLSQEFRPMARLLDRLELATHRLYRWAQKRWKASSS